MVWTPPRTWVSGETVAATTFNTHVRDNQLALSTYTAYTPSWTAATVNPTIGNGTRVGGYIQTGDHVEFYFQIVMGSTTTYGTGAYTVSLPVNPLFSRFMMVGTARDDSATASYPLFGELGVSGVVNLRVLPNSAGTSFNSASSSSPFTWANLDSMVVSGTYRAA